MIEEFKKEQISMNKCLTSYPDVKTSDFQELYESGFQKEVTKPNLKCVILCTGKDQGEIDEQGVVIVEKALSRLSSDFNIDMMRKIITDCSKPRGTDACDTAFQQTKCTAAMILANQDKVFIKTK